MSFIEYVREDPSTNDPINELARLNHFTIPDLEQNRLGKIANGQIPMLFGSALGPIRHAGGALVGWLLFCLAIKYWVPGIIMKIASMLGVPQGAIFGVTTLTSALAFVAGVFKSIRSILLLLLDLASGKVSYIDGRITVSREEQNGVGLARLHGEKHTKCWFVIRGEHFEASEEACAEENAPSGKVRLYYAPRSRIMVSLDTAASPGSTPARAPAAPAAVASPTAPSATPAAPNPASSR